MADQEPKKPELTPQAGPEQPKTEQPKAAPTPYDLDFVKKVDAKREEYEKKTEALKKRFNSVGSIGKDTGELMNARQINRLRRAADQKKSEFQALAVSEKSQRMALMLGETEQTFINIYFPYEKIIDYVRKLNKVDDADLVKIEALMDAMVKLKTNPVLEKLFFKALNKEKLDPKEMAALVDQIKPMPIQQDIAKNDPNTLFEAGQTGAIIAVMPESQRLELVQLIFKNKPIAEASAILDNFLMAGVISTLQLQTLLKNGSIPEPYASELKKQMDQGDLSKKQNEYQAKLLKLEEINQGRNANNVVNKTFGAPLVFGAAAVWGTITALLNLKMAGWNPAKMGPFGYIGALAAGVGTAGIVKIADPKTYGELREKAVDLMSGKETLDAKQATRKEELQVTLETELGKNPYLMEFLSTIEPFPGGQKKTDMEVIQDLIKEKQAKKQALDFTYQEIFDRSGPKQKDYLAKGYAALGSKEINFKDSMRGIMATLTGLQLNTPDKLLALTAKVKKQQGTA